MTNKIKEAIGYINSLQIDYWDKQYYAECMRKIRSLLQEANEKAVTVNNSLILLPNGDGYCMCCGDINDGKIQTDTCFGCDAPIEWTEQQEEVKEEVLIKIEDFHIGFEYEEYVLCHHGSRYLNNDGFEWKRRVYDFNSPKLLKIKKQIENGLVRHCSAKKVGW